MLFHDLLQCTRPQPAQLSWTTDLLAQKQHEQALGEYFQAYRLAPEHPIVLLSIATALANQTMSPHVKDRDRTVLQAFAFMQVWHAGCNCAWLL